LYISIFYPGFLNKQARLSSGLGHRPLKAGIAGSPKGTPSEESRITEQKVLS